MTGSRYRTFRLAVASRASDIAAHVRQPMRTRPAASRSPSSVIVMSLCRASRVVTMLAIGVMPGASWHHAESATVRRSSIDRGVASAESRQVQAAAQPVARLHVQLVVFALRPVPDITNGTATMEYRPYILFANGSVGEAFDDDPDLLDAAVVARLATQRADQWGRWQRGPRGLVIDWNNGARDRISEPVDATPSGSGARLEGAYVQRDSTFRTHGAQPGGSVLRFFADGRFERAPMPSGGSREARRGARAPERGRYQIARWTIRLMHDDGRREQRLFYRFPSGSGMIGVGGASFMRDMTKGRRP